ncbi:endothelin-converting enzyme 1-like [Amblyomma americanum]
MGKKTKGEKPAVGDKKSGRRKHRSTKTDSEPANPSAGKSEKEADPTSPLSSTTGVGADVPNAGEETAASPGQPQQTQATTTAATVSGEATAKAKYSDSSEPEPQGGQPTGVAVPECEPRIAEQLNVGATSPPLASPGSSDAPPPRPSGGGGGSPVPVQSSGQQQQKPQAPGAHSGVDHGAEGRTVVKTSALDSLSPTTRVITEAATILRSPVTKLFTAEHGAWRKKVVVALVALVVAIGTIALMALAAEVQFGRKRKAYCDSEDCLSHVDMLTTNLDGNIDPCEDFSAYVCSAWTRSAEYREHVKGPIDAMLYARFLRFSTMLAEGAKKLPVGDKALAMYESCMSSDTTEVTNLDNFRRLMKAIGLSWPEQPTANVSALGTLLVMAYKWQMPLWMSVTVPVTRDTAKWRLQIKPGHYITVLRNQYENVRSGGGYTEYWHGYYNAFRTNSTQQLDEPSIEAVADDEGAILENLKSSVVSLKKIPAVIPFASIGNYSAPLSSDAWLQQLNLHLELTPPVLADHQVIASDIRFLTTVGALFANYSSQRLLSQLSWSFVQLYAPISSPKLHVVRFGDRWKADLYRPVFCAVHVESTFKLLAFTLDYVSRLTRQDELVVNMGYSSLISELLIMLNNSPWLDLESRKLATSKVQSVQAIIWPSPHWFDNDDLEELYSDYPSKEETFGDYWINARFAMAKHNRTDEFHAIQGLPMNVPPADFEYDYVLNNIEVPIAIVNKPLYYKRGTWAMFYGGLGFQMALEILNALDKEGLHWNSDGEPVTSIVSEGSMKTFESKDSCLKGEGIESIFPEIPALEVAHSAMMRAIKSDKRALTVEGLSEERVFFMTICYMMCSSTTAYDLYHTCDKVVRNSLAFRKAFGCSNGTKMNPTKKCAFFT